MQHHRRSEPRRPDVQRALGFEFPQTWALPVLRIRFHPEPQITAFCGTATVLGGNLVVGAAHVLEDAAAGEDQPSVAIIRESDPVHRPARITEVERHPDPETDLAIARFDAAELPRPFAQFALATGWVRVRSFGYPNELVRPTELDDYRFQGRCLEGHVLRQLEPGAREFQVTAPALELSFPVAEGMSGSPIFTFNALDPKTRFLCGIAIGSRRTGVAQDYTIEQSEGGSPLREERVERVVEVGIAIRVSDYMHWPIRMLDGQELGQLLQPQDGEVTSS